MVPDFRPTHQVSINWCIAKGTCPIPGARTTAQAAANVSLGGRDKVTVGVRRQRGATG